MHKKDGKLSVYVKTISAVVGIVAMTVTGIPGSYAVAGSFNAGSFFGGMAAGHMVGGMVRRSRIRTAATVDMAKSQRRAATPVQHPAPTYVQQPAPAPQLTTEQRLHQLDKLAAGGYITKEEYKTRRKAILDSL